MLGGFLFAFWRVVEIITLIPIIGMLVGDAQPDPERS
jgi:hypothetical protein